MPRPKGSKNKKTLNKTVTAASVDSVAITAADAIQESAALDEQITAVEAEVLAARAEWVAAKDKLKKLKQAKVKADARAAKQKAKEEAEAAAKKAEEDKAKLLEAVAASGKTIEEVLEMLK